MDLNQKIEFIEVIREHSELYDKDNPCFHDYQKKEEIWNLIGEKFNISEPKKKWATLRDKFVRLKRLTEKASESDTEHRPNEKWHLYEPLSFLANYCRHRKRSSFDFSKDIKNEYHTSLKKIKLENTSKTKRIATQSSPEYFEFAYTSGNDETSPFEYQEEEEENGSIVADYNLLSDDDESVARIKNETSSEKTSNCKTNLNDETENMLFTKMIGKKLELLSNRDRNKIQIHILQLVNKELDKFDL